MLINKRNLVLDIYDYSGNKQCTIYDSTSDVSGQATDVVVVTERNGWKELSFTLPCTCETVDGGIENNYRLDYLKADYRIRAKDDDGIEWFLISEPKITHNAFSKNVSVSANSTASLLKTKNLGLEFSDKEGNNVGTAGELLETILKGTGWTPGVVEEFKEKRTGAIKARSMKASAKTGAFKLISNMCDLFDAKPIYHTDTKKVDIVHMNPFSIPEGQTMPDIADEKKGEVLELHYSKNVKNVARTVNTENIVTKLHVYGAFGDKTNGYCGIDEIEYQEYSYTVDQQIDAGTECRITAYDDIAEIEYVRYFVPSENIAADSILTWSLFDPASMSYVWNTNTEKAYRVTQEKQTNISYNDMPKLTGISEKKQNNFSFMMDFDYYSSIGLLSDGMLQTIADYQHSMPEYLKTANEASTQFNESLSELSSIIGNVDFCKLDVASYSKDSAGYVQLHLNTEEHPNGVIYRTDYLKKEREYFKWRVAEKLKDNGDSSNDVAAIIYIVHATDPVTYHKAYLKAKNQEDNPQILTLWTKENFNYSTDDSVYLFHSNSISGYLGAAQVSDESIVETMASATKVVTMKHPTYYMTRDPYNNNENIDAFEEYGWWWTYDSQKTKAQTLYFCWKNMGDSVWRPVLFGKRPPRSNDPGQTSSLKIKYYWYDWRHAQLYECIAVSIGSPIVSQWRKFGSTATKDAPGEDRVVALFSTVWSKYMERDSYNLGVYQYQTLDITKSILDKYGIDNRLPIGNYAIEDDYKNYHSFTTKEPLGADKKIIYDSTNRWVICASKSVDPESITPADAIEQAIETRDYRFDNVFTSPDNVLSETQWTLGTLNTGTGTNYYDPDNTQIIPDGGGEKDRTDRYRSGFCQVFPNTFYEVTDITTTNRSFIFFYTLEHSYLGYMQINGTNPQQDKQFKTSINTRFIRVVSPTASAPATIRAINYSSAFVAKDESYYILGKGSGSGILKGIIPLTGKFRDAADQAYETEKAALDQAQKNCDDKELELVNTLGDIYREGYWQKSDYVDGDEEKLYIDGLENLKKIAEPQVTYNVSYLDLYDANQSSFEYAEDDIAAATNWPDIKPSFAIHLVDPEIGISQWAFIDKLSKCYDCPWKTQISINTNLSTIAQHSFTDVMTHIANVASEVNSKMEVYNRAENFTQTGQMAAELLQGKIDANTLLITGGSSTWYTDKKGNLMFVSSDDSSAMALTGNGFAIANSKDENGEWNWRTFGTGDGFTADEIVAGFLQAERILAGSITTNQLSPEVGENINISSNPYFVDGMTQTNLAINENAAKIESLQKDTAASLEVTSKRIDGLDALSDTVAEHEDTLDNIGTHVVISPDAGLVLRQDQNAEYEARLDSNKLSFIKQATSEAVAEFGANGAVIDRVQSKKKLSVGTEEDGWFDMTVMPQGLADKWRDGTNQLNKILITEQPESVCVTNVDAVGEVTLKTSIQATSCELYRRDWTKNSQTWSKISNPTIQINDDNTITVQITDVEKDDGSGDRELPTAKLGFEYRCVVNGTETTEPFRLFISGAPVAMLSHKEVTHVQGTYQPVVTCYAIGNNITYQWQRTITTNNTWANIRNANDRTFGVRDSYTGLRCLVSDGTGITTVTEACIVTQTTS